MPDGGSDSSLWSVIAVLCGGSGVVGVIGTKAIDYLGVRKREARGDRRQAESGWGKLITRLEKRLDATEMQAEEAEQRAIRCERGHATCRATVTLLTGALNEARERLGLSAFKAALDEEHEEA